MTSCNHVANTHKKSLHPWFFLTLLCKENKSTKHLLVTGLIAQKSLRTHTKISNSGILELPFRQLFCLIFTPSKKY